MHSLLLLHATTEKMLAAALACPAEGLVVDLGGTDGPDESCALLARARDSIRQALLIRVHPLGSGLTDRDLDAALPARPDGIVLPETRDGADVEHLSVKLAVREAELGLPDGTTRIIAGAAATPASVFELGRLAGSSARLSGLVFDADALARRLGLATPAADEEPGAPLALARSLALFAAKSAGVAAFETAPLQAEKGQLRQACARARRDGFDGVLTAKSDHIAIIHAAFAAE